CGQCGKACSVPGGSATCNEGQCTILSCSYLYGDCDHDAGNGCETYLYYNAQNCGSCGNSCTLKPNTVATACYGATCSYTQCQQYYQDCDFNAQNGCETNVSADPNHCGSCYIRCPAGQTCADAGCACTDAGQIPCSGTCTDPTTDTANCGGCGRACF